MPEGTIEWGTLRQAFLEGQAAMMWHSTGNFYVFKDTSPEEFATPPELIEFMASPRTGGLVDRDGLHGCVARSL